MYLKVNIMLMALLLGGLARVNAQNTPTGKTAPIMLDEQADLQSQLISLDSIIDIAVAHSPTIKFQSDMVNNAQAQLDMGRLQWTNNIVGFVNYSGGNQNLVTSDTQ